MSGPAPRLRHQPVLLGEALVALAIASVLIALFPFRSIARLAGGGGGTALPAASTATARHVEAALAAWAERVPWRAVCFQQGLAALFMLRRRRLAATLYYGAGRGSEGELVAHVWVRSGAVDVVGCAIADDFALLAAFPAASH